MRLALIALVLAPALFAQGVPEGLSSSDWSGIRAAYEAGRHKVFAVDGGHQARSPSQQWLVHFDGRGVGVQPDGGGWTWGLELVSFGFAGNEREVVAPPSVREEGQRLTYAWNDALAEWYVNGQGGLEHGYTVHTRPDGDGTLTFLLRVRGGLSPTVQNSGRDVVFQRDGETRLDYTGLKVFDADGKDLPARFTVQPEGLLLSIDERRARYPVTVDPIAQHAYLKASNTNAGDRFGRAVAVSGDTVVVGALGEDSNATGVNGNQADNTINSAGAAYVFVRVGTTWSQQAYLKASNTGDGDQFGLAVAISGDTIVVGANSEDSSATGVNGNQADNSSSGAGAAYVFVRSGTSWSQQAYLKASNTDTNDSFGSSVAVSDDTIVVGAWHEGSNATGVNGNQADNSAGVAGAAYVFVRSGAIWTQQAYLKASNTASNDQFGHAVAVSEGTIVVSAPFEASNATGVNGNQGDDSAPQAGAAYVFVRSGTTWSLEAYIKASNTNAGDRFGQSVAVSGDTIVVGGVFEDSSATGINGNQADNSASQAGAAYVFVRNITTWSQQAYLKASNSNTDDRFGVSVAISGDTIAVGAELEASNATGTNGNQADNSADDSGAAYVFVRSGSLWNQLAYLKASNTEGHGSPLAGDYFGGAVAVSGDTIVVGAFSEDSNAINASGSQYDNSASLAGSAYVFDLRGGSLGRIPAPSQQAYLKASTTSADDTFGDSIAVFGDTVVVGATGEDSDSTGVNGNQANNSAPDAGAAYVFVRNGSTWSQQAYLKASNTGAGDAFGYAVAVENDTIVVGAQREDSGSTGINGNQADNSDTDAGAAYVFVRNGTTWSQLLYLKASNTQDNDRFGYRVGVSGDTIVVGSPFEDSSATGINGNQADNSASQAGAAYVFVRTGTWSQQAYLKASNTNGSDYFGVSASISGDTIVIGAYGESSNATGVNGNQANNSAFESGAAYVFVRSGTTWSQQAYLKASNTGASDIFGWSVAVSGDTVVVGAYGEDSGTTGVNGNQADNSSSDSGAAYVFTRSGTTWSTQAYLKASNTGSGDAFGYWADVSGDTIVVGAYLEDSNASGIDGNQLDNSASAAGAAYVFSRCGTSWTQRAYLKASNAAAGDNFGFRVAVSNDTVVAGAFGEASSATGVNGNQADNSLNNAGAAYVFDFSRVRPSLWPLNAPQIGQSWTIAVENINPNPGAALFIVGFTRFPLPGIDLGPLLGMDCCDLYQTPDGSAPMVTAGSSATWNWPVVAGSPGDRFWCQAACLDPGVNPLGVSVSNQVEVTLVP